MSETFAELFGYSHKRTLEFFFLHLKDVTDEDNPSTDELLYASSVLAHFAQVSTATEIQGSLPTAQNLTTVFDRYVYDELAPQDSESLEHAGAEVLLLAGFFSTQMSRRHNIGWYEELGRTFYARAGQLGQSRKRALLLALIAEHFPYWRFKFQVLSQEFRDRPYVIRPHAQG